VRTDRKQTHRSNRLSSDPSKATALRVAQATFEGLAPLLIEHGITSPEAEALLRAVCVHAAAKTWTTSGRPNVSRTSVKTGVDRHVVAALLREPPGAERSASSRRDAISRVIEGWLTDPEYSDKGVPHDLDIGGPGSKGPTVWSVAQRYAPGVWPRLIVDELIRVDYVEALPNGQLRWKRAPSPKVGSKRSSRESSSQLMRHAVQALFRDASRPDAKTSWCTARSLEIDEQDVPLVRKMLRERLNTMFAWITDELNSTRWQHDGLSLNARIRAGVSGFTFEEILPRDLANDKVKKARRPKT
jgi:Family of unknown function (DUF6502)